MKAFTIMLSGVDKSTKDVQRIDFYKFYDINAKVNHQFSERSKLFFAWYNGRDVYAPEEWGSYRDAFEFGNRAISLRYNHVLASNAMVNVTLYNSHFDYTNTRQQLIRGKNNEVVSENSLTNTSGVDDYSAKVSFEQGIARHRLNYGMQYLHQTLTPGVTSFHSDKMKGYFNTDTTIEYRYTNHVAGLYLSDDFKIHHRLSLTVGMRLDAVRAGSKNYIEPQPRLMARYSLTESLAVRSSVTRTAQYMQLLSFTSSGSPSDMWVPATDNVRPATANEFSIGAGYTPAPGYELSFDLFHKQMNHLIMYEEGASYVTESGDWQDKIATGRGKSDGMELSLKKERGMTTGWLSYTLQKTTRQFADINQGREFPFTFDRTHNLAIALVQKLGKHWEMGANWMYATGFAVTIAQTEYFVNEPFGDYARQTGYYYSGDKNSTRVPDFHRLDLCFNYKSKIKFIDYKLSMGAYNLYARKNPYYVVDGENPGIVSLWGVLPYCGLSVKF